MEFLNKSDSWIGRMHYPTLHSVACLAKPFPVFFFLLSPWTLALRSIPGLPVYHLSCFCTLLGNHGGPNELVGPFVPVTPHSGTGRAGSLSEKPQPRVRQGAGGGNRTHVPTAVEPLTLTLDYGALFYFNNWFWMAIIWILIPAKTGESPARWRKEAFLVLWRCVLTLPPPPPTKGLLYK